MNTYLVEKEKSKCCGCATCAHICPVNALHMEYDAEGFAFPAVNSELCIDCNKCGVVCPIDRGQKYTGTPNVYAAFSKDKTVIRASSSGGIFTEIAKEFISNGGYVCGCTIDHAHQVRHIVIDRAEDIPLLQGSKYVQSDLSGCLSRVSDLLKQGKNLLFVGTPCQVSAIKNAFNHSNLTTIDLLCHGVPSQKLFDFYIEYLEKKHKGTLSEIVFRDKEKFGWSITQRYKIKKRNFEKTYYLERHTSEYFSGFLRNMTQRKSCFTCPYTSFNRVGDITLADFWGVEKVRPELLNLDGTSLVIANSDVGQNLIEAIKHNISISSVDPKDATYQNINLFSPPEKSAFREEIYRQIFSLGFKTAGKKYLLPKNSYKYKIAQLLNVNVTKISFMRRKPH